MALAFLTISSLAQANDLLVLIRSRSQGSSMTVARIKGSCRTLKAAKEDLTDRCKSVVLNTVVNNYVDFIFSSEVRTVNFSGNGQQIKPDDDTAVQPVNRIVFSDGISNLTKRAVGSCTYHNPHLGASDIVCTATTDGGQIYSAVFNTEGNLPEIISPTGAR